MTRLPARPVTATPATTSVAAVVVTYNRRALLLEALDAVLGQTRPPDRVIVVDNASTDGTAATLLSRHPTLELLRLSRNLGGAGGFAAGLAAALDGSGGGVDAVWLMDDDTVPRPDALAALLDARDRPASPPPLVASRVVWTDGRDHPMNTPRPDPLARRGERAAAAAAGCRPIRTASFVSILVDASAVGRVGLPQADYFLWNDDFEFTARLLRHGGGLWCPRSVAVHKTAVFGGADADPGERFFLEVRNKVWTFRSPAAFSPVERLLYAGATLRRWLRTFARAADRRSLRRQLYRGLLAGVRTRPRPTEQVLADAGAPSRHLAPVSRAR